MKRDLFVFAGQSNMMGAAVYQPKLPLDLRRSFEYKHKPRRLGAPTGAFVPAGYPVGEFSYADLSKAYAPYSVNEKGESTLNNYIKNTFFCPAMSNLRSDADKTVCTFSCFSEATAQNGATLAPFIAKEWEKRGGACAYAHIAKGGVPAAYFFTDEMAAEYDRLIAEYNSENGAAYSPVSPDSRMPGAGEYFFEKCRDFFADAAERFKGEALDNKCFFWLQGESDARRTEYEYRLKLDILWDRLKRIGFTHFFIIRVDFFGNGHIDRVMRAQERFAAETPGAYMLTRAASFFTYARRDESEWFVSPPDETYQNCRDSFYGYDNQHINEKGFSVIAARAAENLYRVLTEGLPPVLEDENVRTLTEE